MANKLIAIYLRLSLEDADSRKLSKDESNSITSQRSIITKFIEADPVLRDIETREFVDDGYSGTNFERPAFKKMIKLVRSGDITCIIVKDLSRFARNYIDAGDYLEHIFPYLGVRFIAVNDNYDSNKYIGSTGGIDVAFKNFMHELYSADISRKVKASQHMLMKKGKYVSHCPYGYTKPKGQKHQMIPDPVTAPIVRSIFLWAIEGKKSTEIARILNERKIPTPMQYKNLKRKHMTNDAMWSHQAVIRIIKDYKYTGAMVSFKCGNETIRAKAQTRYAPEDYVINEGMHEAIVTHEEYYAANESLRKVRAHGRVSSDKRDRVYYCGHCGRRLRKTFGADEYYSCATPLYIPGALCTGIRWSRTAIEDTVFAIYRHQINLISEAYKRTKEETSEDLLSPLKTKQKSLSVQIKGISGEAATLYEQYRENKLSRDDFLRKKEELSTERIKLQEQLESIEKEIGELLAEQIKENKAIQEVETIMKLSDSSDEELRPRMYDDIDRVIVYDNDELRIQWKFECDFSDYLEVNAI